MAKEHIELKKRESIIDDLNRLHDEISRRAYDLFRNHEGFLLGPLGDWFRAERELVWRPAVELREKDGQFELVAALAGVDPKNLDVQVTPHDILITAEGHHQHDERHGKVHVCEFKTGRLFRTVHFPHPIDPDRVKAEYRNGMLHVTAAMAKRATKTVDVHAA
jgi:HSP20 family molecular chaperone IbpA